MANKLRAISFAAVLAAAPMAVAMAAPGAGMAGNGHEAGTAHPLSGGSDATEPGVAQHGRANSGSYRVSENDNNRTSRGGAISQKQAGAAQPLAGGRDATEPGVSHHGTTTR